MLAGWKLAVTGLPIGATMTPAAGTIAAPPLAATLEWAPTDGDVAGIALVVSATDTCENPDFIFPIMVTVRSDEPDNALGVGDGNTAGDVNGQDGFSGAVAVTGSLSWNAAAHRYEGTIQLRAERDGSANGRCYTIDVVALDSQGNAASTSCCVVVPHDGRSGNGYN